MNHLFTHKLSFPVLPSLPNLPGLPNLPAALVCVAVLSTTSLASDETNSLASLYSQRIDRIELEIHNETERRTTILDQLDSAINELEEITTLQQSQSQKAPDVKTGLSEINQQLESVDKEIELSETLIEQLQKSIDNLPRPSVWRAALGKPGVLQKQRNLATDRYLKHSTEKHQQELVKERESLKRQFATLTEFGRDLTRSAQNAQTLEKKLGKQRRDLELQFIELSSEIVKKQDRRAELISRSEKLRSQPESLQFASLQKRLPDPVNGELARRFAEPKAKGLLKWNGILISAPLGERFSAVADGLVVFADWIQGLGNVAIVDHGSGYMSLYGMAELLMVQVDQLLLAGDPVGTIGEPIGTGSSALYFEIRHNADTLDPQDWLEMRRITQKNEL